MISGIGLLAGIGGAVFAGVPLGLLIGSFGWRPGMLAASGATLAIGLLVWLFVRDDPGQFGYTSAGRVADDPVPAKRHHPFSNLRAMLGLILLSMSRETHCRQCE